MNSLRAFVILFFLALILSFAGCGSSEPESSGSSTASSSAAISATPAPAPAKPTLPAEPTANRTGLLLPFQVEGLWGLIDTQGHIAISPVFDVVDKFDGDVARARQGNLWGLINRQGQWVVNPENTQLSAQEGGLFGYLKNVPEGGQETGYITREGKVIWSTRRGHTGLFREGLAPVWTLAAAGSAPDVSYIRADGSTAFKVPDATHADSFSEGRAAVTKGGKIGFINAEGQWVIEPKYDRVWPFAEGFALVAVIGEKSRPATEREQLMAGSQGALRDVWLKGVYGFVNADGTEIVPPQYDSAWPFREGLAWVEKGGRVGFIDASGSIVIAMEYEKAGFFAGGRAPVMKGGKWGLVGPNGMLAVECQFDAFFEPAPGGDVLMGQFVDGFLPVRIGDKWGYLSDDFKQVIAPAFAEARHFYSRRAAAREIKDGKPGAWGFINPEGEWFVTPQFDKVDDFEDGFARVYRGSRMGCIDTDGKFLRPIAE